MVSRKRAQPDSANHREEREARVAEMMARARRRQQKANLHHEEGVGLIAEVSTSKNRPRKPARVRNEKVPPRNHLRNRTPRR